MLFRHGGLSIELPDDWMDQSTLLFVAPPTREQLPTTANVQQQSEAVSVNFATEPSGNVKKLLARQAEDLKQLDPNFEVLEQAPFQCGLGEGWSYLQRLTIDGLPVRQLTVACAVGPMMVVATAAAPDGRFEAARERLQAVLASMGAAGGEP